MLDVVNIDGVVVVVDVEKAFRNTVFVVVVGTVVGNENGSMTSTTTTTSSTSTSCCCSNRNAIPIEWECVVVVSFLELFLKGICNVVGCWLCVCY